MPPTSAGSLHGLHDAFRMWLDLHPGALEEIKKLRPNGPLAVTHLRGRTVPIPDRFDVMMVSSSMAVNDIQHNYDDAVAAGSDHAYVLVDLSLSA